MVTIYPAVQGNQITKAYFYFLKGENNRGNMLSKVPIRITDRYGNESYYLISEYGGLY